MCPPNYNTLHLLLKQKANILLFYSLSCNRRILSSIFWVIWRWMTTSSEFTTEINWRLFYNCRILWQNVPIIRKRMYQNSNHQSEIKHHKIFLVLHPFLCQYEGADNNLRNIHTFLSGFLRNQNVRFSESLTILTRTIEKTYGKILSRIYPQSNTSWVMSIWTR